MLDFAIAFAFVLVVVVGAQVLMTVGAIRGTDPAERAEILDALQETRFVHPLIVRMFRRHQSLHDTEETP